MTVDPFDSSQDDVFRGWLDVAEAAGRAEYGDRHTSYSVDEMRAAFRDQQDKRRIACAGLADGAVVGHLEVTHPLSDNTHRAEIALFVHPDHRRRGVGSALLDVAERLARDERRKVVGGFSDVASGHDDPASGFAAAHGYAAEQTEWRSDLVVPVDERVLADASAEASSRSDGYEVLTSWDGVPDEWLADRAELSRRMSTDTPLGGVALDEEEWDEDRVRRDFEVARDQGRRVVESVARHSASGRIVGFTTLAVASHTPQTAYQWSTLVLKEHRGHRLGLLLKVENLRALLAGLPAVRRVVTWNAADNAPMLRVNRALGFEPVGRLTEWQRWLV